MLKRYSSETQVAFNNFVPWIQEIFNLLAPRVLYLTLILLMWRIWWAPNNARKWQMGFNSAFKGLIQINHQPDATVFQFITLTFVYSSTCFGRFPAHHHELSDCSGSLWFYFRIVVTVVLCSWSGRPAWPHGKTPETCWAVNKRQDNKLKNCCIRLVIFFNCTMMHGLTNLKFYI